MSRFAFITIAIIRFRFVSITNAIMKTLRKYIFIVITIIIIIRTVKAETEQEKKKREEREERETYLGMRGHELLLNYPGCCCWCIQPALFAGTGHFLDRPVALSWVQCLLLFNLPRGSPEVATLSNTIDNGIKCIEFGNWPCM